MEISQYSVIIRSVCVNFQQFYVLSKHFLSLKRRRPLFRSTLHHAVLYAVLVMAGLPRLCLTQFLVFYPSTRSLALAGAETCLSGEDVAGSNPAGAITTQKRTVTVACFLPFGMKELAVKSLSAQLRGTRNHWTLSLCHMGFTSYQEGMLRLSCSREINSRFHLGLSLRYGWLQISRYGTSATLFLDAGFIHHICQTLCWGAAGKNLLQRYLGAGQETAPQTLQIGFSWTPVPGATIHIDRQQESPFPPRLRMGLEIECWKILVLRWGWATAPANLGAGLAVRQKKWRLDYGCLDHPDLGLTHSTALTLFW